MLAGVKQLILASFNGGAARTRAQRRMTSTAKITMAISRNTTDSIRRTKFAQEKTDDSQSAGCDGRKAARCSKALGRFGRPFTGVQKQRVELSLRFCR
jgi:hypothetical protein